MTSNPFEQRRSSPPNEGTLKPGDVRIIEAKDKNGHVIKTYTLHRTDRPYVYDLCDAYNEGRTRDDTEWFVTEKGELMLGSRQKWATDHTKALARQAEAERQRWLTTHHERG